jgi:hypothetical protein
MNTLLLVWCIGLTVAVVANHFCIRGVLDICAKQVGINTMMREFIQDILKKLADK